MLGQLYKTEDPEEVQELTPVYRQNENPTLPSNNDLSQFSENAVLSPPTTDDAVQLSCTAVLTSDDLHTIPIASRDTSPLTVDDCVEPRDEQVDAVIGEETEERTEDTVLLTPEDSTTATTATTCNKESEQGIYETGFVTH